MTRVDIWLVFRLIKKQKLRTVAIYCGMLFSCIMLITFCSFGYDFWEQVHQGAGEEAEFDFTQNVLILLITVLLLLILLCAAILLHNLFSLTFPRRWQSLTRLLSLGAEPGSLVGMGVVETVLLYAAAAPAGTALSLAAVHWVGTQCHIPAWMTAVILVGIFLFSCACNLRPMLSVLRQPVIRRTQGRVRLQMASHAISDMPSEIRRIQGRVHRRKQRSFDCFGQRHKGRIFGMQNRRNGGRTVRSFSRFLSARYRQAGRWRYFRTTVTILVAILLYVPAGYLIDTNISVQRSGLYEKYGIQYSCHPGNQDRLEDALEEYRRLADYCKRGDSMGYAVLDTTACVHTDEISGEFRSELRKAGWRESPLLYVDSAVFFLEDEVYAAYTEERSVLVNRYTNRSSWLEEADLLFAGTPLLKEGADLGGVEVYTSFTDDGEADPESGITPRALKDEIPEGLDDTGSLALIMPLSRLEEFCSAGIDYDRLQVQGRFADSDEEQFIRLERCLGENPAGRLVYTRQVFQEWYSSMEGIHRAMNAVCATLFSIAVLNVFSMMIFQYMERKRGLAILWSLGQSLGGLFRLLLLERMHHFLTAMLAGIPLSLILCYSIYGIFRRVWQIPFALPLRQIALIGAAVLIVLGLTATVNGYLIKRQDFLANIKEIT